MKCKNDGKVKWLLAKYGGGRHAGKCLLKGLSEVDIQLLENIKYSEEVDMEWVFLVIVMASTELIQWDIQHLIPERRFSRSRRPGLTSREMFRSKEEWKAELSLWEPPLKYFSYWCKRVL